ncbi:MAG: TatD family hydrolase [Bacteroidia bacterium]|jgi:TatD DNase family protein|nr:TatD family hydrolase [Bacteroidia bacterium]GIV24270.1 MAG: TatD family hydrolase [Bacteroidia bacterium]
MEARLIDTHAHLFLKDFAGEEEAVTHRARSICEAVLLPNLDSHTLPDLKKLIQLAPDFYFGMIGLHPNHVKENFPEELTLLEQHLSTYPWIAIGEIGLDLYHETSTRAWQEEALFRQAEWAIQYNLPVSIHFRNALDESLEVLRPFIGRLKGVFHCFTGSYEEGKKIIDQGFYLGIGGVLTYKKATALQEAVKKLPLDRLLLETDSPYLTPTPFRGRRNESSYLLYTARTLAELRQLPLSTLIERTTENARALFALPHGRNGS